MPGPTSKASRALADVRLQLKAGTTRKGSALELEEISALEEKRGRMVAEMRAKRQKNPRPHRGGLLWPGSMSLLIPEGPAMAAWSLRGGGAWWSPEMRHAEPCAARQR